MGVNDNITLNRVLDVIQEIAENHENLGVGHFSIGDAATRGHDKGEKDDEANELLYPYLWADPASTGYQIGQTRNISAKTYSISLFCADKHSDNALNDTEILSDTEGIVSDVVQYIATHPDLKKYSIPVGVVTANPARHTTIHEAYGWEIVLAIQVPYAFCHNNLPIAGSISTGGGGCKAAKVTINGATFLNVASGATLDIPVVNTLDTPVGIINVNEVVIPDVSWTDSDGSPQSTPYGQAITCTAGGGPVGINLNGVTDLTDAASGTTRTINFFDEEDNVVTPTVDVDNALTTNLIFSDVPMTFNGSAIAGALVGGSKAIVVQDTDGTQVGTKILDQQAQLTIEVAKPVTDIIHVRDLFQAGDQETVNGSQGWYKTNTTFFDDNQPAAGLGVKLDPNNPALLLTENEWGNFNRVTNDRGGSNYADVGGGLTSDGATANVALDNYTGMLFYLESLHAGTEHWDDSVVTAQAHTVARYDGSTYNQWAMLPPKLVQHILTGDGQDSHILIGIENWSDSFHWIMGLSVGGSACYFWRENQPWNATNLFNSFSRTSVNAGIDLIVCARKEDFV